MKKIAGITLWAVLALILTACNSGVSQAEYADCIEPDELMAAAICDELYDELDDVLIDLDICPFAPYSGERHGEITHIVIHFISNVIENPANPYIMEDIQRILREYGVSVHYIIDREGTVHAGVSEHRVAFHAGAGSLPDFPEYENMLNEHSIGIELLGIGTQEEMSLFLTACAYLALDPDLIGFTDAQYDALNSLINDILARHPAIRPNRRHIIGHSEYSPTRPDPGELFQWERLDFMNSS